MAAETRVRTVVKQTRFDDWEPIREHPGLYHREILSAAEADALGVRASSVLWERIDVGGGVLPHYHNVAELIHITAGRVLLYADGAWHQYEAGDTFHVPAGVVHSVLNDGDAPSEQISVFLPAEDAPPPNAWFETTKVDVALPPGRGRGAASAGAMGEASAADDAAGEAAATAGAVGEASAAGESAGEAVPAVDPNAAAGGIASGTGGSGP